MNEIVTVSEESTMHKTIVAVAGEHVVETIDLPLHEESPSAPGPAWKLLWGKLILRFCPAPKTFCDNRTCRLRPFCACARLEWARANRIENTVWIAIAGCGALVILGACLWALMRHA